MTLAEFLAWEERQPQRHEYWRGEVFGPIEGSARHSRIVLNLATRINAHLKGTGCQVFASSMRAQFEQEGVLYPDVMVTCASAAAGDQKAFSDPQLVIEVLSPDTKGYDKRDKFALYRHFASLREYALIDPMTREVEVFVLSASGSWKFTDQTRAAALTFASIELTIPSGAVFDGVGDQVPGRDQMTMRSTSSRLT
jgi:Uma2 family endonuclease